MQRLLRTAVLLVFFLLVSGGVMAADHFLATPQDARYQDQKPGAGDAGLKVSLA